MSSSAVRWNDVTGVAQRMTSSTIVSGRSRTQRSHWSGLSKNAFMPWVVALRVVSLPATARAITKKPNSSSVSPRPSLSAWTSLVTMSSRGFAFRSAARPMAYISTSVDAACGSTPDSGSSDVIWLVHTKSFCRSSGGTPSMSAMVSSGSWAATCSTKLPLPWATASATIRFARVSMISSSALIARGVNPREMIWRVAVCSGASWLMITKRVSSTDSRVAVSGNRMIAPFS
jgi:hypothetical protein